MELLDRLVHQPDVDTSDPPIRRALRILKSLQDENADFNDLSDPRIQKCAEIFSELVDPTDIRQPSDYRAPSRSESLDVEIDSVGCNDIGYAKKGFRKPRTRSRAITEVRNRNIERPYDAFGTQHERGGRKADIECPCSTCYEYKNSFPAVIDISGYQVEEWVDDSLRSPTLGGTHHHDARVEDEEQLQFDDDLQSAMQDSLTEHEKHQRTESQQFETRWKAEEAREVDQAERQSISELKLDMARRNPTTLLEDEVDNIIKAAVESVNKAGESGPCFHSLAHEIDDANKNLHNKMRELHSANSARTEELLAEIAQLHNQVEMLTREKKEENRARVHAEEIVHELTTQMSSKTKATPSAVPDVSSQRMDSTEQRGNAAGQQPQRSASDPLPHGPRRRSSMRQSGSPGRNFNVRFSNTTLHHTIPNDSDLESPPPSYQSFQTELAARNGPTEEPGRSAGGDNKAASSEETSGNPAQSDEAGVDTLRQRFDRNLQFAPRPALLQLPHQHYYHPYLPYPTSPPYPVSPSGPVSPGPPPYHAATYGQQPPYPPPYHMYSQSQPSTRAPYPEDWRPRHLEPQAAYYPPSPARNGPFPAQSVGVGYFPQQTRPIATAASSQPGSRSQSPAASSPISPQRPRPVSMPGPTPGYYPTTWRM